MATADGKNHMYDVFKDQRAQCLSGYRNVNTLGRLGYCSLYFALSDYLPGFELPNDKSD